MRKNFIALIDIMFASYTSFGQISFGIKPSFLIVNAKLFVNDKYSPGYFAAEMSPRYSYAVGLTIHDQLNKQFSIQLEPRLIIKGYNIKWRMAWADGHDFYKNNYLSLPALFIVNPFNNLKKLSFNFGPELSYLLNSKYNYPSTAPFNKRSEGLNHLEFSMSTGLSYRVLKRFDFGIQYGFGLTPCQNSELFWMADPISYGADFKTYYRYFEFSLNTRIFGKTKDY